MTTIEISLPEDLAERAKSAGLLSDERDPATAGEDAMRRRAGRALLNVAKRIHDAAIRQSDDEVVAEVKAVRAERRAR